MKKAILMMTFGSPEEITFEGVADFFTNIRRGVRPQDHEIQTLYDNYVLIGGTPLQNKHYTHSPACLLPRQPLLE